MLGLGFAVLWGGYLIFNLGFYMVKGVSVSITDLALPSHANAAHQLIGAGAGAKPAAGPDRQSIGKVGPVPVSSQQGVSIVGPKPDITKPWTWFG